MYNCKHCLRIFARSSPSEIHKVFLCKIYAGKLLNVSDKSEKFVCVSFYMEVQLKMLDAGTSCLLADAICSFI